VLLALERLVLATAAQHVPERTAGATASACLALSRAARAHLDELCDFAIGLAQRGGDADAAERR
jgi:hypothetical protein